MTEPVSTTVVASASLSVGLFALLAGRFGGVAADVMMVIMAAIAGCLISLTEKRNQHSFLGALRMLAMSVCMSLILSWALASVLANMWATMKSPYIPSLFALLLGYVNYNLPSLLRALIVGGLHRAGIFWLPAGSKITDFPKGYFNKVEVPKIETNEEGA